MFSSLPGRILGENDLSGSAPRDTSYAKSSLKSPSPRRIHFADTKTEPTNETSVAAPYSDVDGTYRASAFRPPEKVNDMSASYGGSFRKIDMDDLNQTEQTISSFKKPEVVDTAAPSVGFRRNYTPQSFSAQTSPSYGKTFNNLSLGDMRSVPKETFQERSRSAPILFDDESVSSRSGQSVHKDEGTQVPSQHRLDQQNVGSTSGSGANRHVAPTALPDYEASVKEYIDSYVSNGTNVTSGSHAYSTPGPSNRTANDTFPTICSCRPEQRSGRSSSDGARGQNLAGSFRDSLYSTYNTGRTHLSQLKSSYTPTNEDSLLSRPNFTRDSLNTSNDFEDRYPNVASAIARIERARELSRTTMDDVETLLGPPQATSTPRATPRDKQFSPGLQFF